MSELDRKPLATAHTREKILLETARLFATHGYAAVSMRDIADHVGIRSSSIYNYYDGKEQLLREIVQRFLTEYSKYWKWLDEANAAATSIDQIIDNLFEKLLVIDDPFTYYGIVIVLKEQFTSDFVRDVAFRAFHMDNIATIKRQLDRVMEFGGVTLCDTQTIATTLMYNVLVGTELRIHEWLGYPGPIDCTKMYLALKEMVHALVAREVNVGKVKLKQAQ